MLKELLVVSTTIAIAVSSLAQAKVEAIGTASNDAVKKLNSIVSKPAITVDIKVEKKNK